MHRDLLIRNLLIISVLISFTGCSKADPSYYNSKGIEQGRLENYRLAIKNFNKAIRTDSTYRKAYYNRGISKTKIRDFEGAIVDLTIAIRFFPDSSNAFNNRGVAFRELGNHKNAIMDFNKAIELNSTYYLPYYNKGISYFEQENFTAAVSEFNKSIGIIPLGSSYFYRAKAFFALGDNNNGCADIEKAIEHRIEGARKLKDFYCN